MYTSLESKLKLSLKNAVLYHSDLFVKPEVLLWPDPEKQWEAIIPELQKSIKELIVLGNYNPESKQGPAIYIKCLVARTLPEANWSEADVPIIYLPGYSKNDIKNLSTAALEYQPLMEYQYTGTMWLQENGKEWTINAFLQNKSEGLNLSVSQDSVTRDLLKKSLVTYFKEEDTLKIKEHIDADYLYSIVFPEFTPVLLKWVCKGDDSLRAMNEDKQKIFREMCKLRFGIDANYSNIREIVQKLASRKNSWDNVWQYYSNSPHKYPEIEEWLRQLTPPSVSLWSDVKEIEPWPQINDEKESELRKQFLLLRDHSFMEAAEIIKRLDDEHKGRRKTVWAELGQAPLTIAIMHFNEMAQLIQKSFPSNNLDELQEYYISAGYKIDNLMRVAYAITKTNEDKEAIRTVLNVIYKPWLENITNKFQQLVFSKEGSITNSNPNIPDESYTLFVDAFRYELAKDFIDNNFDPAYKVEFHSIWSALPSLTPTSKPFNSPIAKEVSNNSAFSEFRPQLKDGKELNFNTFKSAVQKENITFVTKTEEIQANGNHWQEFGEIDRKGHEDQAEMIRRLPEQLEKLKELIDNIFSSGIKRIKIVTDHGWLLLPGGLPKSTLPKELTETRWGRCAIIKEGVKIDFPYLPWQWNPSVHIAYAPGISFFKINEEYAHGGLSLQECLIPIIILEKKSELIIDVKINSVKWINLKCVIEVENAQQGYTIDIRTKYTDPSSSVILSKNTEIKDGKCTVFVDDEAENQTVTIILLDNKGIIIDKQIGIVGN